jgi:hypothetical protein
MVEVTFNSPGVYTREIDLSQPTSRGPSGIPAGIIGTSVRGPAFVPVTVADFTSFISVFGNTDGEKFGPMAMREWLRNARAGTFLRVLGTGDGKARNADGTVTNAGFIVGDKLPQGNGLLGDNKFAETAFASLDPLARGNIAKPGRTFVLGCFMSESIGSTYLQDSGIIAPHEVKQAHGIVRGMILAASGVIVTMSSSIVSDNAFTTLTSKAAIDFTDNMPNSTGSIQGNPLGDVLQDGTQTFQLLINGMKDTSKRVKTLSFDPDSDTYFAKQLNKDPLKLEEEGILLYSHFDVRSKFALPVQHHYTSGSAAGSGFGDASSRPLVAVGFVMSSSAARNSGSLSNKVSTKQGSVGFVGYPNLENFQDRFTTAVTPFVISQKFGGKAQSLFRLHARDDGAAGGGSYKATIENIKTSDNPNNPYGTFDLTLRKIDDTDKNKITIDAFRGCDLNPSSDNYVERRVGSKHVYFDFDKKSGGQKLVEIPGYENKSPYVRIEMSSYMNGNPDKSALPMGFRGIGHLVTSGSAAKQDTATPGNKKLLWSPGVSGTVAFGPNYLGVKSIKQPPIPMRDNIKEGSEADSSFTWGIQFEVKPSPSTPNISQKFDESILNFIKHYPTHSKNAQPVFVSNNPGAASAGGCILDCDKFNKNQFTLENIEVLTSSITSKPDTENWAAARYRRSGVLVGTATAADNSTYVTRFLKSTDLSDTTCQNLAKFTFPFVGGFDGLNIFDREKSKLTDIAAKRELLDTPQGLKSGPSVAAYRKAVDIMEEKSDVDIQLLAIPGIRQPNITDHAMESVERRFDALYILDIENKDSTNNFVTSSGPPFASVTNTVAGFSSRNLDTSFAAAYYPDVVVTDEAIGAPIDCPPSVAVLGALSLNDTKGAPWTAPAGLNRGTLESVTEASVKLKRADLDNLYVNKINPIVAINGAGPVIYGQKTLQAAQTALDRINVRRLLIDVRRKVKSVANGLLFEPNREDTLVKFNNSVVPILNNIQQAQGLDAFKVQIDTTTTTQADVENNTIRGKIFLQPTRSVEFISLDFVVTNAGS